MIERAWSPEQISNHLKINYKEFSELHVSTEAIYQSVYSNPNRRHLIQALRWKKKKRGRRNRNGILRGGIKNRVSIHQRDKAVLKRIEVGHWESDLIVGSKNQGAIGTAVERVSRYTLLVHLDGKMTSHVVEKFGAAINTMPDFLKKSVTHDNGTEMAHHETLSGKCGILVFFADPGCPWQRPTNENTNGLLREFFPKGTDLRRVTEEELEKVQFLLNNRPRKCLGFKTPQQVIDELIKEKGNNKAPRI
jgi:IS30 family transposase